MRRSSGCWVGVAAVAMLLPVQGGARAKAPSEAVGRTVAITVDDLPFAAGVPVAGQAAKVWVATRVNAAILGSLRRHGAPATGFAIEQGAEELGTAASRRILEGWTRPGFDLGNHFRTHGDTNELSVAEIEGEITGAKRR